MERLAGDGQVGDRKAATKNEAGLKREQAIRPRGRKKYQALPENHG